jgi:hypothetical protein
VEEPTWVGDAGTVLDRQTLYELVWSKPTAYLAQEYGISDVALGKMCQGMNVPKPPRGYWAKVRRGYKLPRPPLPPDSTSARTQVVIHPPKPRPPRPDPPPPAGPNIPVPTRLHDPHRLVARTAAVLKKQKPGRDGIVFPYGDGALKIEVSEANRPASGRGTMRNRAGGEAHDSWELSLRGHSIRGNRSAPHRAVPLLQVPQGERCGFRSGRPCSFSQLQPHQG